MRFAIKSVCRALSLMISLISLSVLPAALPSVLIFLILSSSVTCGVKRVKDNAFVDDGSVIDFHFLKPKLVQRTQVHPRNP